MATRPSGLCANAPERPSGARRGFVREGGGEPAVAGVETHDLVDPALVPPALERGGQERANDLARTVRPRGATSERENVRVVVLAAQPRRLQVADGGGPDPPDLVGGHRHANPGAAHQDTA